MKLKQLTASCLLLAAFTSQAEPAKRETIEQLLRVTDAANMLDIAYQQIDAMNLEAVKQSGVDINSDPLLRKHLKQINELVRQELSWQQLEEPFIALYGTVFSEDELQDILAFYQSQSGQKMLKRQPELIQQLMVMMQQKAAALQPKIEALVKQQQAERKAQTADSKQAKPD